MPDPSRPPEWMAREIMARFAAWERGELPAREEPKTEAQSLAELGYDGSRLRRRYWKKVTEVAQHKCADGNGSERTEE